MALGKIMKFTSKKGNEFSKLILGFGLKKDERGTPEGQVKSKELLEDFVQRIRNNWDHEYGSVSFFINDLQEEYNMRVKNGYIDQEKASKFLASDLEAGVIRSVSICKPSSK